MARTAAQRKADALVQMAADAVANPNGMAPVDSTHNIVWSKAAYEEMVRRFAGAKPGPFDVDDYRCETIDGDPLEAFANSLVNKFRRVIIGAKSVAIDLGRARRFTRLGRDAVRITGNECFWPGCWIPATRCETNHLDDHASGDRTNPESGAPACGRYNRWKQKGYTVTRHANGQIRTHRPNGTEIA